MPRDILEKIAVGAGTAVALGLLAVLWNWASEGGLVRSLGGVTQAQMEGFAGVPAGAVLAFDRGEGCPEGWTLFESAISRTIVGAVGPSRAMEPPTKDMHGNRLSARQYRSDGGEEKHLLTETEMPRHGHDIRYQGINIVTLDNTPFLNAGENRYLIKPEAFVGGKGNIRSQFTAMPRDTEAAPHNNMPPFVALYFCKKA